MKLVARMLLIAVATVSCMACSAKIVPVPTATALPGPVEGSLSEMRDGIAVTVKIDQLSVQPYQPVDNLASIHIAIDNRTDRKIEVAPGAFVLRDGENNQYLTVSPERVREIVSKDTVYLIPYPYVGYYYLEDQRQDSFHQTMTSSLPFYAEYHPQNIFTRALPSGPVLPHSKVSGVIYFLADLTRTDHVELLLYPDPRFEGEPRYRFPFRVEK
ncbi:MAG: hypothetical protein FDZ69_00785 [Deltaproteobacteria bacterium]|nr:MAG: hypothetical protein FDZ69_00785 [Deltaproteobacteria bacterium]